MMDLYVSPFEFGAVGDGRHDDTLALQSALAAAQSRKQSVTLTGGIFCTDCLTLLPGVSVTAEPTWGYRRNGNAVLVPLRAEQPYLLDCSNATGVTLRGLCVDGGHMGENMHGIYCHRSTINRDLGEHTVRIEDCQIKGFTGDGAHLEGIWAISVRGSHFHDNAGYGFYLDGTDAFVVDNWFSGNGIGFGSDTWNSAVNFTSNRVEWNKRCGLRLCGSMRYNVTGNYFDRSFGPAIVIEDAKNYHKRLEKTHTVMPYAITITGNNIVRSGKEAVPDSDDDCHILMKNAVGVTITSNTFNVWKDDGRHGRVSPWNGIIYENCSHCVIAHNTMLPGAVKALFVDRGGHNTGVTVMDNVGDTVPEKAWHCQDPFTPVHFMSEGHAPWFSEKLQGENND